MKVRDIMSSPVEMIAPDAMITEAADKMKSYDVGVLPVEKDGDIVGVITDRDIVIRAIADGLDPQRTPVSKAMTFDAMCLRRYRYGRSCKNNGSKKDSQAVNS